MSAHSGGPASAQAFTRDLVNVYRFKARVATSTPNKCWEWQGARGAGGYGVVCVKKFRSGPVHAHRVAYVIKHGSIPKGMCVLHKCDNPPCVNPAHLRLGTHTENMADAARKGRTYGRRRTHCKDGHALPVYGGTARHCRVCRAEKAARQQARLRAGRVDAGARETGDFVEQFIAPLLPATLASLAARSDERRAFIVARAFGCYGFAPATLQDIGDDFGITRERTRQLRNHVLLGLGVTREVIREIPRRIAWKQEAAKAAA